MPISGAYTPLSAPGATKTGLQASWPGVSGAALRIAAQLLFRRPEAGAQSVVQCAVAENAAEYVGKIVSDGQLLSVTQEGRDYKFAERLWDRSLAMTDLENSPTVPEQ